MNKDEIPDFLRIEIVHADGVEIFDPTSLLVAAFEDPDFPARLSPLKTKSAISEEPGFIYRTDQVEIALSAGEIRRLTMRSLSPTEFLAIRKITGDFHEIHDDFYDPVSGEAFQPKE